MKRIPIGSRPTSREELSGWYSSILDLQARSGLNMRDFAAGAGVSAWSLYQWRRRLSGAVGRHDEPAPRLVEVAVAQKEPSQADCLHVRLRCGHRVDVPSDFDSDGLRRLIEVLESC
jgi:hypothetical protein